MRARRHVRRVRRLMRRPPFFLRDFIVMDRRELRVGLFFIL
jgi:hypothetical protein